MHSQNNRTGFTLIELSIVMVIIALIVGGILVGREMITSATIRSQLSQIDQIKTAASAFKGKYNCVPGDCAAAASFGFQARGGAGTGDGNGVVEGNYGGYGPTNICGSCQNGENITFFVDLSSAGLLPYKLVGNPLATGPDTADTAVIATYFPRGQLPSTFVTIYGDGVGVGPYSSTNFIGLSDANYYSVAGYNIGLGGLATVRNIPAVQAYSMDAKIDDGMPIAGKVTARDLNGFAGTATSSVAVAASTSTCYDNAGSTSNPVIYTTSVNQGAGANCAISFEVRF